MISSLKRMWDLQITLQKRVQDVDLPAFLPEHLPWIVTSIVAETGEILEAVQAWKHWRKNPPPFDRDHVLEEFVDVMHFVVDLGLYLGFSAEEVMAKFEEKNAENHSRQDRGY